MPRTSEMGWKVDIPLRSRMAGSGHKLRPEDDLARIPWSGAKSCRSSGAADGASPPQLCAQRRRHGEVDRQGARTRWPPGLVGLPHARRRRFDAEIAEALSNFS